MDAGVLGLPQPARGRQDKVRLALAARHGEFGDAAREGERADEAPRELIEIVRRHRVRDRGRSRRRRRRLGGGLGGSLLGRDRRRQTGRQGDGRQDDPQRLVLCVQDGSSSSFFSPEGLRCPFSSC